MEIDYKLVGSQAFTLQVAKKDSYILLYGKEAGKRLI
jgi:hypothetical protein